MTKISLFQKLEDLGVDRQLYTSASVLCLPENFIEESDVDKYFEPADQIWLVKRLREEGAEVFTLWDAGIDTLYLERRGDNWWLGKVVIDKIAIPALVAVLSGIAVVAYERETATNSEQTASKDQTTVHIELTVRGDGEEKILNYDGDSETLIQLIKQI